VLAKALRPDAPATGYGYISSKQADCTDNMPVFEWRICKKNRIETAKTIM